VSESSPEVEAEFRPGGVLVLAPGTLHLTLTSQGGSGRDGGTKLALGHRRVNNGLVADNQKTAWCASPTWLPEGQFLKLRFRK
jgi:hypothetical protein